MSYSTRSMYLDLHALADEYQELKDKADETDEPLTNDEFERLEVLETLATDLGYDPIYLKYAANDISQLVDEDDWEDYVREFAEEAGYLSDTQNNPLLNYIDWEGFAKDLQMDYSSVDFENTTYYYNN